MWVESPLFCPSCSRPPVSFSHCFEFKFGFGQPLVADMGTIDGVNGGLGHRSPDRRVTLVDHGSGVESGQYVLENPTLGGAM